MEEKDKYYTPELSEFYVGFEYEIDDTWGSFRKVIFTEEVFKDKWIPIGSGNDRVAFDYKARVKKLDREDIDGLIHESWELKTIEFIEDNVYEFSFNKAGIDYQGFYTYSDKMISFYEKDNSEHNKLDCFFRGTIKNKSELKKLLTQLGIL